MELWEEAGVTKEELEEHRNRVLQLYIKLAEALIQANEEAALCGNTERRKEPTVKVQIINPGVIDENECAVRKAVLAALKRRKCMRERDGQK